MCVCVLLWVHRMIKSLLALALPALALGYLGIDVSQRTYMNSFQCAVK